MSKCFDCIHYSGYWLEPGVPDDNGECSKVFDGGVCSTVKLESGKYDKLKTLNVHAAFSCTFFESLVELPRSGEDSE